MKVKGSIMKITGRVITQQEVEVDEYRFLSMVSNYIRDECDFKKSYVIKGGKVISGGFVQYGAHDSWEEHIVRDATKLDFAVEFVLKKLKENENARTDKT